MIRACTTRGFRKLTVVAGALAALLLVLLGQPSLASATPSQCNDTSWGGFYSSYYWHGIEGYVTKDGPSVYNNAYAHAIAYVDLSVDPSVEGGQSCDGINNKNGPDCWIQDGNGIGCVGGYVDGSCGGGAETSTDDAYLEENDLDAYHVVFYSPSQVGLGDQNFFNAFYTGVTKGSCGAGGHFQVETYTFENGSPLLIGAAYFDLCAP